CWIGIGGDAADAVDADTDEIVCAVRAGDRVANRRRARIGADEAMHAGLLTDKFASGGVFSGRRRDTGGGVSVVDLTFVEADQTTHPGAVDWRKTLCPEIGQ